MKKNYKLIGGCNMPNLFNKFSSILLKTLLAGCLFLLSFNSLYASGSIQGDSVVCVGSTWSYCYHPAPSGSTSYFWHVSSGGTFTLGPGDSCIYVTWNTAGNDSISLIVYDNVNCNRIDSVIKFILVNPLPAPGIYTFTNQACVTLDAANPIGTTRGGAGGKDTCYLVCDSSQTIFFSSFVAGATYTWTVTGASGDTISTSAIDTTYTVNWGDTLGVAEIHLVVTTPAGCSDSVTRCVEIIQKPHCKFYGDTVACGGTLNICAGQTVTFTDSSTSSPQSGINSWLWNFGDLTTSTNTNPTHVYTNPGTYIVKLIITTHCGCKDSCMLTVNVDSLQGPHIYCPTTICAGDTAFYWTDALCNTYNWSVTGGTIIPPGNRDTIRVIWGNGNSGPGIISLSIPCAASCPYSNYVLVPIVPINGIIYGQNIVCPGTFTHYHMNCIPGTFYQWTLSNSLGVITTNSNGPPQIDIYWNASDSSGWDTITVNYTNSLLGCGGTAKLIVHITQSFTLISPQEACAGDTTNFYTSIGATGIFNWVVYDDFTHLVIHSVSGAAGFTQIWPPVTTVSTYTVYAIDTLGLYCNSPQTYTVTVYPLPPQPDSISGKTCICPGGTYVYSANASPGTYLQWTILNGSPSIWVGPSVTVTWNVTGPYVILLQQGMIASPHCLSIADTDTVFVCPPISGVISGPDSACINTSTSYTFPPGADEYFWSLIGTTSNNGTILPPNGTNTITIQWGNTPGKDTIKLKYTKCGISDSVTFVVTITGPPTPTIIYSPPICLDQSATFTIPVGDFSGTNTYLWSINSNIATTTNVSSWTHTFTSVGTDTIYLTVADINNCLQSGYASTIIQVDTIPAGYIYTPDSIVFCDSALNFPETLFAVVTNLANPQIGPATYDWYRNSVSLGIFTSSLSINNFGQYYCIITGSDGCSITSNVIDIIHSCGDTGCVASDTVGFTYTENCGTVIFTGNPQMGYIPGTFTWDFGDFSGSTLQNPTHIYTHAGHYTVTFCASYYGNSGTCITQVCTTHIVTVPVIPNFSVNFSCNNISGITMHLVDSSSVIGPQTDTWLVNPGAHTHTGLTFDLAGLAPGPYNITLTVTVAGYPDTCTITKIDTVPIQPIASFTFAPNPVCSGDTVHFTNTSTNQGAIIQYSWDFGDFSGSNLSNPTKTYNVTSFSGFGVTLTITDEYGCTSTASGTVIVFPNTITINTTAMPPVACEGDSIIIDANANSTYLPLTYSWIPCGHFTEFDTVTQTGWYTVVVTDSVGCKAKDSAYAKFLDVPDPTISGPLNYCNGDNINLSMYIGPGYTYMWTISSAFSGTTTILGADLNGISLNDYTPPSPYPYHITAYISITAPIFCQKVDSTIVWVHWPPPQPVVSATDTCIKDAPIVLTATDLNPNVIFNWSTGGYGNTISVINSGNYAVYATDSFGCSSQSNPFRIPPLPDFCTFFTGCICDTGNQVLWAPVGPTVVGWLRNDTLLSSTANFLVITLPGTYQLILENTPGCPDTSGFIFVDDCHPKLPCCDGDITYFDTLVCLGVDSLNHRIYHFDIYCLDSFRCQMHDTLYVNIVSGVLSNISSNVLLPYPTVNHISGTFTDLTGQDTNICLELIISGVCDSVQVACEQDFCGPLPLCNLKPCDQDIIVCPDEMILCDSTDQYGNPLYEIVFAINYSGTNGSIFSISSSQGVFSSLSSNILHSGINSYTVIFDDLPPMDGMVCMDFTITDSIRGTCWQEICFRLPDCFPKYCKQNLLLDSVSCWQTVNGHHEYLIWLFLNALPHPYTWNLVSGEGLISSLSPLTFQPGPNTVNFIFTDYADSGYACFRSIFTDSTTRCEDTICITLPTCPASAAQSAHLSLAPNPAKKSTDIRYLFTLTGNNAIVIRDVYGRERKRILLTNAFGDVTVDLSDLHEGVYFVNAENNNKVLQTLKLVVIN